MKRLHRKLWEKYPSKGAVFDNLFIHNYYFFTIVTNDKRYITHIVLGNNRFSWGSEGIQIVLDTLGSLFSAHTVLALYNEKYQLLDVLYDVSKFAKLKIEYRDLNEDGRLEFWYTKNESIYSGGHVLYLFDLYRIDNDRFRKLYGYKLDHICKAEEIYRKVTASRYENAFVFQGYESNAVNRRIDIHTVYKVIP